MLFFGVSLLTAGVPVVGMLAGSELAMAIAGIFLQIAIVFIVAGAAGMYLSRSRRLLLPNEQPSTSEGARPTLGGWLIALAVTLAALPVWLVVRLQSFLAEWGRVVDYLATWDIWSGGDANGSGLVLVPLAGALTPPMFELAAAVSMLATSVMLIALLLLRSQRFPRVYLVSLILSAAPVIASVRGASAAALAGSAVTATHRRHKRERRRVRAADRRPPALYEHRRVDRACSGVDFVRLSHLDTGASLLAAGQVDICSKR